MSLKSKILMTKVFDHQTYHILSNETNLNRCYVGDRLRPTPTYA